MCLVHGGVGGEVCAWIRGLALGFTIPVGTWGVLEVCLRLGSGSVGGIGGQWVGSLDQGLDGLGWCNDCVSCESGLSNYIISYVYEFGPGK